MLLSAVELVGAGAARAGARARDAVAGTGPAAMAATGENCSAFEDSDATSPSAVGSAAGAADAAAAARAAILRFSSLTSERNLSGVIRESIARTRSSSGGCVANQEA